MVVASFGEICCDLVGSLVIHVSRIPSAFTSPTFVEVCDQGLELFCLSLYSHMVLL